MQSRSDLRQLITVKRRSLSAAIQHNAAVQLAEQISQFSIFQQAKHIAGYMALHGELSVLPLIQMGWQTSKLCYLPIMHFTGNKILSFAKYQPDTQLQANHYGILEPLYCTENLLEPCYIDLILVPLLAFDKQANRLGAGGGFYDRTFAFLSDLPRPAKPFLLGIAYAWQQVAEVPIETWDIPMDAIATDTQLILPKK